jgi:hypothetical protein
MKNNLLKNAALTVVLLLTIFDPGNAQIFSSSRQLNAANSQNNGKVVSPNRGTKRSRSYGIFSRRCAAGTRKRNAV